MKASRGTTLKLAIAGVLFVAAGVVAYVFNAGPGADVAAAQHQRPPSPYEKVGTDQDGNTEPDDPELIEQLHDEDGNRIPLDGPTNRYAPVDPNDPPR